MGRLKGKRAIVTGAGSGIGRASALLFAREGAFWQGSTGARRARPGGCWTRVSERAGEPLHSIT